MFLWLALNLSAQPQKHLYFSQDIHISFDTEPPILDCDYNSNQLAYYYTGSNGEFLFQNDLNKNPWALYSTTGKMVGGMDSAISNSTRYMIPSLFLILPKTDSSWYLFSSHTVYHDTSYSYLYNYNPGLYYSVIYRVTEDSFFLSERNVLVYPGQLRQLNYTPKGENSYWLTAQHQDSFMAFTVSPDQISSPTISVLPERGVFGRFYMPEITRGACFSWGGAKYINIRGNTRETAMYLYDFDTSTGMFSNQQVIGHHPDRLPNGDSVVYGWSYPPIFSPNDSFFYTIETIDSTAIHVGGNGQVSFSQSNRTEFWQYETYAQSGLHRRHRMTHMFYLDSTYRALIGQWMTLGPNGKIYLPAKGRLACLLYPNKPASKQKLELLENGICNPGTNFQPNYEYWPVSFNHTRTCEGVEFTNTSDRMFTQFTWYFQTGDSTFDTLSVPTAKYAWPSTGKYFVKMKAQKPSGYSAWTSDSVVYIAPPDVDFSVNDSQYCRYADVEFNIEIKTDTLNKNSEFLKVKLSDGFDTTFTGSIAPAFAFHHAFADTGVFHATIIYSNGFCTDTIIKDSILEIIDAPKAGFAADPLEGCTPLQVDISNKSAGKISSYFYTFGNGQSDTIPEPTVTYTIPDFYKITQSLTGPTGCVTKDSALVHVMPGITAADTVEMLRATVQPDETVLVEWQPLTNAVYYRVTRDGEELPKQQSLTLTDHSAQPENRSYTYQVAAFDSCDNSSTPSRIARTILLTGQNIENEYALLTWNAYEEWQQGVQDYALQMRLSDSTWASVTSTLALELKDHDFLEMEQNEMCYRLVATELNGNSQQSNSNVACVPYLPVLFIPNAFSPNGDGRNDVWQPLALAMKDYKLQVYNRWGQKLFSTTNPFEGWDGKARANARASASVGEVLPEGTYLYRISAVSHTGQGFVREGTVVLLR